MPCFAGLDRSAGEAAQGFGMASLRSATGQDGVSDPPLRGKKHHPRSFGAAARGAQNRQAVLPSFFT